MNKIAHLLRMISARAYSDRIALHSDRALQQFIPPTRRQPATDMDCVGNQAGRERNRMVDRQASDAARRLWCSAEHF